MHVVQYNGPEISETASPDYGVRELSSANCEARTVRRDDRSEEAILNGTSDDDEQGNR